MLRNSHLILSDAEQITKTRAAAMMKSHRNGKGDFYTFDQMALLRWPASNKVGEGDGQWTTVISGGLATCACPAFQRGVHKKPCKHLVLAARLAVYNARKDAKEAEEAEKKLMVVCTG